MGCKKLVQEGIFPALKVVHNNFSAQENSGSYLEYMAFGETFVEEHSNTDRTPYLFNGKELDEETGLYLYGLRYYDPRTSIWLSVDPLAEKFPNWSPYVYTYNNPLNYIDPTGMGPDDPETHVIQKGETLTSISKKYGVTVDDLAKLNGIENKDKIKAGETLKVNPEVDFKDNPHGGYQNPNNSVGEKVTMNSLVNIAAGFIAGTGGDNHIVVGGEALESIQGWDKVTDLISRGIEALNADGKLTPGETFKDSYSPGTLASYMKRALKGEEDLISPVHIIGSFNLTMRVNADKKSVTIAVYDSKTISSFSDNKLDKSSNRSWDNSKKNNQPLTTQYFRFIWNQQIKK